jgi:hypothetical protein
LSGTRKSTEEHDVSETDPVPEIWFSFFRVPEDEQSKKTETLIYLSLERKLFYFLEKCLVNEKRPVF